MRCEYDIPRLLEFRVVTSCCGAGILPAKYLPETKNLKLTLISQEGCTTRNGLADNHGKNTPRSTVG